MHVARRGAPGRRARRLAVTRAYLAVLAALILAVACAPVGRGSPQPADPMATAMLMAVNAARAEPRACGAEAFPAAPPLRLNARLSVAAQAHSEDMRAMGALTHTGSDGSDVVRRAERQGYAWSRLAENVAWGYEDVPGVVAGWLGSPGHCRNIMSADHVELGLGRAGAYWTQVFGAPR